MQLRDRGYDLRDVADALLRVHMHGGTPLFTFYDGPGGNLTGKKLDTRNMTFNDLRDRAYFTVKADMGAIRRELDDETPAHEKKAEATWQARRRLQNGLREINQRRYGDPDAKPIPVPAVTDVRTWRLLTLDAIEIALKIAQLDGVDVSKPTEIRIPEVYRVFIDEGGVVQQEKLKEEKPN